MVGSTIQRSMNDHFLVAYHHWRSCSWDSFWASLQMLCFKRSKLIAFWRRILYLQTNILYPFMLTWALDWFAGGWRNLHFFANARIPILKLETSHSISCDISINNLSGQMKSKLLFWMNEIDGRFRDMVLLACFLTLL